MSLVTRALRYAGVRGVAEAGVMDVMRRVACEAERAVAFRHVMRECALEVLAGGVVVDGVAFESSDLSAWLGGATRAVVVVGTLGLEADAFVRRCAARGVYDGMAAHAVCTALLEIKMDAVCGARFSPGYGDFGIEAQARVVALAGGERLGGTVNGAHVMTPLKTVTALAAAYGGAPCVPRGCLACGMPNCTFRTPPA